MAGLVIALFSLGFAWPAFSVAHLSSLNGRDDAVKQEMENPDMLILYTSILFRWSRLSGKLGWSGD